LDNANAALAENEEAQEDENNSFVADFTGLSN